MTLVNHETGEVVECMTSDQARRLTVEAQNEFISAADHFEKGWAKVEEAVRGGGYLALGYNSPGHYLHAEFDGVLAGIDPADRRVAVRSMAEWGLSSRAIAPVVGVTDRQARRDISGGTSVPPAQTPEPAESGEADAGSGQAPEGEATPSSGNNEVEVAETPAPRPPVVGIDGKTYSRPEAPTPKPVLDGAAAEYDNAERASKSLARAVAKLLEFEHPNMRAGMRRYWDTASIEVPPAQRADVTPEQMRVAAHGLLALADEWIPK